MAHSSSSQSGLFKTGRWQPNRRWRKRPPFILLAEDDLADQELARRALSGRRCDIHMVADGTALIDYLENVEDASDKPRHRPDIILLDLNMPRLDGREALAQIRSMELVAAVPIVVFSTSDNLVDIKLCYEAGCNSYVTKPSELDEFNTALNHVAHYWLDVCALP